MSLPFSSITDLGTRIYRNFFGVHHGGLLHENMQNYKGKDYLQRMIVNLRDETRQEIETIKSLIKKRRPELIANLDKQIGALPKITDSLDALPLLKETICDVNNCFRQLVLKSDRGLATEAQAAIDTLTQDLNAVEDANFQVSKQKKMGLLVGNLIDQVKNYAIVDEDHKIYFPLLSALKSGAKDNDDDDDEVDTLFSLLHFIAPYPSADLPLDELDQIKNSDFSLLTTVEAKELAGAAIAYVEDALVALNSMEINLDLNDIYHQISLIKLEMERLDDFDDVDPARRAQSLRNEMQISLKALINEAYECKVTPDNMSYLQYALNSGLHTDDNHLKFIRKSVLCYGNDQELLKDINAAIKMIKKGMTQATSADGLLSSLYIGRAYHPMPEEAQTIIAELEKLGASLKT